MNIYLKQKVINEVMIVCTLLHRRKQSRSSVKVESGRILNVVAAILNFTISIIIYWQGQLNRILKHIPIAVKKVTGNCFKYEINPYYTTFYEEYLQIEILFEFKK